MKWVSIIFIIGTISTFLYFNQKPSKKQSPKIVQNIKIDDDISEFYKSKEFKNIAIETKSLEDEIERLINPKSKIEIPKIDFVSFTFKPNIPINYLSKLREYKNYKKTIKKKTIKKISKKIDIIIKKKIVKKRNIINKNSLKLSVDILSQRLKVYKNNKLLHNWKISTGKRGYSTPRGKYKPQLMQKMHYSRKYNNAPMPYSIFFRGGYAFHGTKATRRLGRVASHGCIRLRTSNAKKLFYLVKQVGKNNAFVHIY